MCRRIYSTSKNDDVLHDFIKPELQQATKYYRSTGHFSSSFLISAADIFADYFDSWKEMRVLCCVELSDKDYQAMIEGDSEEIIEGSIFIELQTFEEKVTYLKTHSLEAFKKLFESGQIQIKVVVPKHGGIYHQKYGLIYRPDRNSAFMGGFNLSFSGHEKNSEMCTTYTDQDSFNQFEEIFLSVWDGKSENDKTYDFPEACKLKIINTVKAELDKRTMTSSDGEKTLYDLLWPHQKAAFNAFFKADCVGILQMATGTGKTRLALTIIDKLVNSGKVKLIVIVASRNPLLNQWRKEIFNLLPYTTIRRYGEYDELNLVRPYLRNKRSVVVLTSYLHLDSVEKNISEVKDSMIICDEVHNLGSEMNVEVLKGRISKYPIRLGLSATPERMYDEVGTEFIQSEIGNIIFEYHLKDAIADGVLCKFNYIPIRYEITAEENEKIVKLSKLRYIKDPDIAVSEAEIRRRISDVYKKSKEKYEPFEKFISKNKDLLKRCIVFVADKEYGEGVQKILFRLDPYTKYHTFYDDDPEDYLINFSKNQLDCLITCNKISEGIDIADVKTIILFSASRSDSETLQRIGRCLRKDPKNPTKIANIVDFVIERKLAEEGSADHDRYYMLKELCEKVIE